MSRRSLITPEDNLIRSQRRGVPNVRMWSEQETPPRVAWDGYEEEPGFDVPWPAFTANRIMAGGDSSNGGSWSGPIDPDSHVAAGDWVVLFLVGHLCGSTLTAPSGFTRLGDGGWPGGFQVGGQWAVFAGRATAGWNPAATVSISGLVGSNPVVYRFQGALAWAFRGLGGGAWAWTTSHVGGGRTVTMAPAPVACVRMQAVLGAGYLSDGWETPYPTGRWYKQSGCITPMGAGVATSGDNRDELGWNAGVWSTQAQALAHFRDQAQHDGTATTSPTSFSTQQWAAGFLTFTPDGSP